MENNFENEINQELEKDKFINFYKKNKIKLIFFLIFFIFSIFGYQLRTIYKNINNSKNIEKILLSKIYLDEKKQEGQSILNEIKDSSDFSISMLSTFQLIDFHLKNGEKNKALKELYFLKNKNKNNERVLDLLTIKEVIIKFDYITENEIVSLLKKNNNKNFAIIKNKLLYDFYIKSNQLKKAEQFIVK